MVSFHNETWTTCCVWTSCTLWMWWGHFFLSNLIFLLGNADNALFFLLKYSLKHLSRVLRGFWEVEKKSTEYMRCSSSCNLTWVWKKELRGALKAANCMACGIWQQMALISHSALQHRTAVWSGSSALHHLLCTLVRPGWDKKGKEKKLNVKQAKSDRYYLCPTSIFLMEDFFQLQ